MLGGYDCIETFPRFVPNVVWRQDDDDNDDNDVTKLEHRSSDAAAATSAMNILTNRIFLSLSLSL